METSDAMKRMVGFRNIAFRDDEKLHRSLPETIVRGHLSDFKNFLTETSLSLHP